MRQIEMSSLPLQETVKNTVKEAADIVEVIGEHVALKRAGLRYTGLCPFHGEKTPSFSVNPQEQFYYCFGCGASGDVFSFLMEYHHIDFPEALKQLAGRYHIDLPERQMSAAEQERIQQRENLYAVLEAAAQCYEKTLADVRLGLQARDYLQGRGVPEEAIARYRLGCAPDPATAGWDYLTRALTGQGFSTDVLVQAGLSAAGKKGGHYDRFRSRVLFPLQDMSGRISGFGGRILGEGQPKYMNSPESPVFSKSRQLFGLYPHRDRIRKLRQALVVEGNFDLLLLAVHGVGNVVAPLGTALTREHVHALGKYCSEVILLFDADAAGLKAAMRSIPFFLEESLEGRVALLPKGHDPDSFVREQGRAAVEDLAEKALPLAEFALDRLMAEHGLTLAGKARIVQELKPLIQAAAGREQRELMTAHFAAKLGVSLSFFSGSTAAPEPPPPASPPAGELQQDGPSALHSLGRQERQLLDFLLFWPEYVQPLQEAGLAEVLHNPALLSLLELMLSHGAATAKQPDYILAAPLEAGERAYVVARLMRQPAWAAEEGSGGAALMFEQMLAWVRQQRQRQSAARLQRELQEAERSGDSKRVLELLRTKQLH